MGIDTEFAYMASFYNNEELKTAIRAAYARSGEPWMIRQQKLIQFAANNGLHITFWAGERVMLHPLGTTRKRPACIIVRGGFPSGYTLSAIRMIHHVGVGHFSVVEHGHVRVDRDSEATAVRREAESPALHS